MKNALVTGASRGIGRAAALRLAADGFAVAVNYLKSERDALEVCRIINENGGTAQSFCADVSDAGQVSRMISDINESLGKIDVLVNNAGVAKQIMFCDIDEAEWDRVFGVDVKGVYLVTQAVLPDMVHFKSGRIINISSIWGLTGGSCEVHYSAAKAAVIGMTKALAKELGPSGITVNCIAPGVIRTDMNSALSEETYSELCGETPLGRIGKPEDIAAAVSFLASEGSSFITGQVIPVDGGIAV